MKNKDIEDKIPDHCVYITTNDFNRFSGTILQDSVLLKIKKERKITNIWFQLFFCKNNFLLLGEGPTDDINGSVDSSEKNFSIKFSKAKKNVCFGLHYNTDSIYSLVFREKIKSLNPKIKMPNFLLNFIYEVHLKNLILLSLKKSHLKKLFTIFQSIMALLINAIY